MGIGVKQIQQGSEICREWAASIARRPLKKGVTRVVTIARDDVTKTIGKTSEFVFVEVKKPDGFQKVVIKGYQPNCTIKSIKYPDGSWSETTYNGVVPYRTNGEFVMTKKDGSVMKFGYGIDGYQRPEEARTNFSKCLKSLGDPSAEADIRDVFGTRSKSIVVRFFGDVNYKIGKFFERFNKTNRTLRKLAREFEAKA